MVPDQGGRWACGSRRSRLGRIGSLAQRASRLALSEPWIEAGSMKDMSTSQSADGVIIVKVFHANSALVVRIVMAGDNVILHRLVILVRLSVSGGRRRRCWVLARIQVDLGLLGIGLPVGRRPCAIFYDGESSIQIGGRQDNAGEAQRPGLVIDLTVVSSEALSRAENKPVSKAVQNEIYDRKSKTRQLLIPGHDEEDCYAYRGKITQGGPRGFVIVLRHLDTTPVSRDCN